MEKFDARSRRKLIKKVAGLAGMALVPLLLVSRNVAAAKLAKADVRYQDRPHARKDCDDCLQFIPGATAKARGTCKIVEGPVSPHGYCLAFTPKPGHG
jgi:hypothetical protein